MKTLTREDANILETAMRLGDSDLWLEPGEEAPLVAMTNRGLLREVVEPDAAGVYKEIVTWTPTPLGELALRIYRLSSLFIVLATISCGGAYSVVDSDDASSDAGDTGVVSPPPDGRSETRDAGVEASADAAVDVAGDAVACGYLNGPCCASRTCAGDLACNPGNLVCQETGNVGQFCRQGACFSGVCTIEYSDWCEPPGLPCGGLGQKCCAGGVCNANAGSCKPRLDGGSYDVCR